MRVRFTKDYDYTPSGEPRAQIVYRADGGPNKDGVYTVKRECGEASLAAGAAVDWTFNGADPDKFDHDKVGGPGGKKKSDAEA